VLEMLLPEFDEINVEATGPDVPYPNHSTIVPVGLA